ncbi:MAG: asparagine synthase-related protein [Bacteroidota bacterium]|nr:asparagine synthase-related protein [Bacteroidota bacterium]
MQKNGIIPSNPLFYNIQNKTVLYTKDLPKHNGPYDYRAICIYAACGFFMDDDTYYTDIKYVKPASKYSINDGLITIEDKPYFEWYYKPRDITLGQAVEEFTELFHDILNTSTKNKKIILPLSGGLDSRTLAAGLKNHPHLWSYSYGFKGGIKETQYSNKIANAEKFAFKAYEIEEGYLWNSIEKLAVINGCMSEFTHARQMAVIDDVSKRGDAFVLGHWGDVLFDGMGVPDNLSFDEQVSILYKKVLKKGGRELGMELWRLWELEGDFDTYLKERLNSALDKIKIDNSNARIRAFKSTHWAPRWTSTNLQIFSRNSENILPYYNDRMCEFICGIPEDILCGRQVQIEYLKKYAPELAKIKWQAYDLNLYSYKRFYHWSNIPNRAYNKVCNIIQKPKILRNWELQFVGDKNEAKLHEYIYYKSLQPLVNENVVKKFEALFHHEPIKYSHALSMLLTLSLFTKLKES